MIAWGDGTVACLGGWRGDRLYVGRPPDPLVFVAELGWDERAQTTPQRRLAVGGGAVFVLEPLSGPLLLPPLRVRRFGEGEFFGPALYYHARRVAPRRTLVTRCGIARGKPAVEEEEVAADLPGRREECSGTPLFARGAWYYPVRMRGLFRGAELLFRGDPAPPQLVGGKVVCAANRRGRPGLWVDGAWHALPGRRLFPDWRAPFGPLVAPLGEGLVVLRREGGDLPGLRAPPARLPPGIYSAILPLCNRLWGLAESDPPRLEEVLGSAAPLP